MLESLTQTVFMPMWALMILVAWGFFAFIAISRWMYWAHEVEMRDLENRIDRMAEH